MAGASPVPHRGIVVMSTIAATLMQRWDTPTLLAAPLNAQVPPSPTAEQIAWLLTS